MSTGAPFSAAKSRAESKSKDSSSGIFNFYKIKIVYTHKLLMFYSISREIF